MAGVPGLEPGPKVLETSMLTIDTIPLCINGKLKVENEKLKIYLHFPLSVFRFPLVTCFLCATDGSGSGDKTF